MGMPQYHDGSFGPIKPIEESLKDLVDNEDEQQRTRALYIGKFEDLLALAQKPPDIGETEPLARILQNEFQRLRMDVNKIMIHLGIDDKSEVLAVRTLL